MPPNHGIFVSWRFGQCCDVTSLATCDCDLSWEESPCLVKTCAERPIFAHRGAGGSRCKHLLKAAVKNRFFSGAQCEAPG